MCTLDTLGRPLWSQRIVVTDRCNAIFMLTESIDKLHKVTWR